MVVSVGMERDAFRRAAMSCLSCAHATWLLDKKGSATEPRSPSISEGFVVKIHATI